MSENEKNYQDLVQLKETAIEIPVKPQMSNWIPVEKDKMSEDNSRANQEFLDAVQQRKEQREHQAAE